MAVRVAEESKVDFRLGETDLLNPSRALKKVKCVSGQLEKK